MLYTQFFTEKAFTVISVKINVYAKYISMRIISRFESSI